MCRISADLSDDEIVQIAAFYASKAFVRANEQIDSDSATRGEKIHNDLGCVLCHSKGGSDQDIEALVHFYGSEGYRH